MIMRNTKENIISFGLTAIATPLYLIWLFLKWFLSQIFDLISMIFNSFKSQFAKYIAGLVVILFVSWLF